MNREELLILWREAEASENMDEAENIYTRILSEPGVQFKLKSTEILDIRWNRAINLVAVADWYIDPNSGERSQPTRALTVTEEAIAEVTRCRQRYRTVEAQAQAHDFLTELEANREEIIKMLEERAAYIPDIGIGL